MITHELYESDARKKILSGFKRVNEAVKVTLGPRGRTVTISRKDKPLIITRDGVTVANSIFPSDLDEKAGVDLAKEASDRQNTKVGDATTDVIILSNAIQEEADKVIESGYNPTLLSQEIDAAKQEVLDYLKSQKIDSSNLETLTKVATLAGHNEEIGTITAKVVHEVGIDGIVKAEPVMRPLTSSEIIKGVAVNSGYKADWMITDYRKMECSYDDVAVILCNCKVHSFHEILPVLDKASKAGTSQAIVIATEFGDDALGNFKLNSESGSFRTLAVEAPSFGENQNQIFKDLSVATGSDVIANDGVSFQDVQNIKNVKKVICTRNKTILIGTDGDVSKRAKDIKEMIAQSEDDYQTDLLKQRLANLIGKVGVIYVGGNTETEILKKKYDFDDAIASSKSALETGALLGGGVTLYRFKSKLSTKGAEVLLEALKAPFRQLVANSGFNVEEYEEKLKDYDINIGCNIITGEFVDLLENGIVDAYGVIESMINIAISMSVQAISGGALIVEE